MKRAVLTVLAMAGTMGLALATARAQAPPSPMLGAQSAMPQPSEADVLKVEIADLSNSQNQYMAVAAYWKAVATKLQTEVAASATKLQACNAAHQPSPSRPHPQPMMAAPPPMPIPPHPAVIHPALPMHPMPPVAPPHPPITAVGKMPIK